MSGREVEASGHRLPASQQVSWITEMDKRDRLLRPGSRIAAGFASIALIPAVLLASAAVWGYYWPSRLDRLLLASAAGGLVADVLAVAWWPGRRWLGTHAAHMNLLALSSALAFA